MTIDRVIPIRTLEDTAKFAKTLEITDEQAGFIEFMRDRYIRYEHDYVKEPILTVEGKDSL